MPTEKLKQLFPRAVAFTLRGDLDPLYFTAFASDPKTPSAKILGYAFWTIDLVPEQLGYHGHIHMLVGMDRAGTLTGVIVDVNTEPYSEISIERPEFPAVSPQPQAHTASQIARDKLTCSRSEQHVFRDEPPGMG